MTRKDQVVIRKKNNFYFNLNFVLSWGSQYVPDKLSVLYWPLRTEEVRGEPFLGFLFVFVTLSSFTIIKSQQKSTCLLPTATHKYFLDCDCLGLQIQRQLSWIFILHNSWQVFWKRTERIVAVLSVFVDCKFSQLWPTKVKLWITKIILYFHRHCTDSQRDVF